VTKKPGNLKPYKPNPNPNANPIPNPNSNLVPKFLTLYAVTLRHLQMYYYT